MSYIKRLNTQPGWDGVFVGVKPSGTITQQGDETISLGSFSAPSFSGFNAQDEKGGNGPTMGPSNGNPSSGQFPGDGTGFDGFGRQNER